MKDYRKGMVVSSVLLALLVGTVAYGANTEGPEATKEKQMVAMAEHEEKSGREKSSDVEKTMKDIEEDTSVLLEEMEENDAIATETMDDSGKVTVSSEKQGEKEDKMLVSSSNRKPGTSSGNISSNGNNQKPEEKPTKPSKPNKPGKPEKPSKPDTSKPNKPTHQHSWVAQKKTINHPEKGHNEQVLVKEAWTEKIPRYKDVAVSICNTCGADITGNTREHIKEHTLAGEGGSWRTEYKSVFSHYEYVEHPAQYTTKYVVDQKAWTETVVTGYKCSCGATK